MNIADMAQIAHEKGLAFSIGPSGWAPDSEITIRIDQGDCHLLKVVNYDNLKKAVDPDISLWTLLTEMIGMITAKTGEAVEIKSEEYDGFRNYLLLFDTPKDVDTFFYKLKARFLQNEISHVDNYPLNWHPGRGPIVISTHKRAWYLDLGQLPEQRMDYTRYHCNFVLSRIMGNAMKDSDFWYRIIDNIVEKEKEDP